MHLILIGSTASTGTASTARVCRILLVQTKQPGERADDDDD